MDDALILTRVTIEPGSLMTYVGEPSLAPAIRRNVDSGGWSEVGGDDLPRGSQCVVVESYGWHQMWVVMTGNGFYRVHEKMLQPSARGKHPAGG